MTKTGKGSIGSLHKLSNTKRNTTLFEVQEPEDGIYGGYQLEIGTSYDLSSLGGEGEAVFRGTIRDDSMNSGLYWNPISNEFEILEEKVEPGAVGILEEVMQGEDTPNKNSKDLLSTPPKKTRTKQSRDEVLCFEIEKENDIMVSLVKQHLNAAKLTSRDLMNKVLGASNLIAGLRQRNSMTLTTFKIWCETLGFEAVVNMVPKK